MHLIRRILKSRNQYESFSPVCGSSENQGCSHRSAICREYLSRIFLDLKEKAPGHIPYAQVLGFCKNSTPLLGQIKQKCFHSSPDQICRCSLLFLIKTDWIFSKKPAKLPVFMRCFSAGKQASRLSMNFRSHRGSFCNGNSAVPNRFHCFPDLSPAEVPERNVRRLSPVRDQKLAPGVTMTPAFSISSSTKMPCCPCGHPGSLPRRTWYLFHLEVPSQCREVPGRGHLFSPRTSDAVLLRCASGPSSAATAAF